MQWLYENTALSAVIGVFSLLLVASFIFGWYRRRKNARAEEKQKPLREFMESEGKGALTPMEVTSFLAWVREIKGKEKREEMKRKLVDELSKAKEALNRAEERGEEGVSELRTDERRARAKLLMAKAAFETGVGRTRRYMNEQMRSREREGRRGGGGVASSGIGDLLSL